jgi:hypothetical protein
VRTAILQCTNLCFGFLPRKFLQANFKLLPKEWLSKKSSRQAWWHTPLTPAIGGGGRRILIPDPSQPKNLRPYMKNKLQPKGLGTELKE